MALLRSRSAIDRLAMQLHSLQLRASPSSCLLRSAGARAFSTAPGSTSASPSSSTSASTSPPPNLILAPEKPRPAPRIVETACKAEYAMDGSVTMQVLAFKDLQACHALTLDGSVFGCPPRNDILHRVVRWQLACRRSGNHKTKTRSEVHGSTRKIIKQKHTGRARAGDARAPQRRGGYTVHGPVVRDHSYSLPKKVRALGLRVALSTKLREGKLAIVDTLELEMSKTKEMQSLLRARNWEHALFVDAKDVPLSLERSTGNLPEITTLSQKRLSVLAILQKDLLVVTKQAVELLEQRLHAD